MTDNDDASTSRQYCRVCGGLHIGYSVNSHRDSEKEAVRSREAKLLTQGHTARKCWRQDSNPYTSGSFPYVSVRTPMVPAWEGLCLNSLKLYPSSSLGVRWSFFYEVTEQ